MTSTSPIPQEIINRRLAHLEDIFQRCPQLCWHELVLWAHFDEKPDAQALDHCPKPADECCKVYRSLG